MVTLNPSVSFLASGFCRAFQNGPGALQRLKALEIVAVTVVVIARACRSLR
jgi:hypothetical protein